MLEGAWVWPKNGPKPAVLALPQHFRSPLSRIAQVWSNPADTATAVRPVPRSIVVEGTGVFMLLTPSPNCPALSLPQHFISPLSRMAQAWYSPAATATAVRFVPKLIAVVDGASVSARGPPLPNCPY